MSTTTTTKVESSPELKKYLEQIVTWKKDWSSGVAKPKNFVYYGAEDFVLQNGRPFDIDYEQLNRFGVRTPKECYKNAVDLVMENPDLTYVEGFATTVVPTLHAWVVDKDGVIADPTWKVDGRDPMFLPTAYYGVMFTPKQCWKVMMKSGSYGVIDSWEAGWPLFKKRFVQEVTL